jgi:hypothetical protein
MRSLCEFLTQYHTAIKHISFAIDERDVEQIQLNCEDLQSDTNKTTKVSLTLTTTTT